MILADTSVWIDHFRRSDPRLTRFLDDGDVVMHAFVIGELALGYVPRIAEMINDLRTLPRAVVADLDEVLKFIAHRKLSGSGIGYVDAHLLAAAALAPETFLWTRDKRLHTVAQSLSLAAEIQD
jgi:predicted nucleic acid-binding protein